MTRNLRESIKRHEGTGPIKNGRLMPYRDVVGKLTIGYGRNLEDNGITQAEAETMLDYDIAVVCQELTKAKPELLHSDALSNERKEVLYEMAYNMGVPRLLRFYHMWAALDKHDYETAAREMLNSKWAGQVGERAMRLHKRMKEGI